MKGEGQSSQVPIPALLLTGYMTLGQSPHFSEPSSIAGGHIPGSGCSAHSFCWPPADTVIGKGGTKKYPGSRWGARASLAARLVKLQGSDLELCDVYSKGRVAPADQWQGSPLSLMSPTSRPCP